MKLFHPIKCSFKIFFKCTNNSIILADPRMPHLAHFQSEMSFVKRKKEWMMPHLEAGHLSWRPRGCSWRCRCRSRSPWASPRPSWAPCAGCRRSRRCPWWWSCGPEWRSPPPRQARASSSSWRTSGRPRPEINMPWCLQSDQVTLLCIPAWPQSQVLYWQGSVRRAGWDELDNEKRYFKFKERC